MKLDVSRDVVSDLWPLVRSGEASPGSRALVEAFLADDQAFAASLRKSETLLPCMPAVQLSPDAERRLLDHARDRARLKLLVIGAAVVLTGLALLAALAGVLLLVFRNGG